MFLVYFSLFQKSSSCEDLLFSPPLRSLKMKVIYLSDNVDFGKLDICQLRNQNKYGVMYALNEKIELVTTEHVTDYHVHRGENSKTFLCFTSAQVQNAIKNLNSTLTTEKALTFKPEKDKLYLKISEDQYLNKPKNQKLHLAVSIYGVFTQSSSNLSFLQMELTSFKAYPLVNFDRQADAFNDNATW